MRRGEYFATDGRYGISNMMRKAIGETPRNAIGTVVDIVIDEADRVENVTEKIREEVIKSVETRKPIMDVRTHKDDRTLAEIFGDELSETFHETESGDGMYARVSFKAGGIKQQYLVYIATNKNADIPVKVIPLVPSGRELFGYSQRKPFKKASIYDVKEDKDNPGEIYLHTMRMERIIRRYKSGETLTREDVKDYVQEIADWTQKMTPQRKDAVSKRYSVKDSVRSKPRERFTYTNGICKKCKRIVISDRAYTAIIAEALSRDPLETGGILLGHYDKGTWYVVEATDPGLSTFHNTVHHEMDDKYHNHVYPVISRLYEKDLCLIGLWHRHPGTLNTFSSDDNMTNVSYSEAIDNGTLSFLLNFEPNAQLTCYYFDYKGTGAYYKPDVKIGDKYFKGTEFLLLADEKTLWDRKKQLQMEINNVG